MHMAKLCQLHVYIWMEYLAIKILCHKSLDRNLVFYATDRTLFGCGNSEKRSWQY